jgi:hypothetical protein
MERSFQTAFICARCARPEKCGTFLFTSCSTCASTAVVPRELIREARGPRSMDGAGPTRGRDARNIPRLTCAKSLACRRRPHGCFDAAGAVAASSRLLNSQCLRGCDATGSAPASIAAATHEPGQRGRGAPITIALASRASPKPSPVPEGRHEARTRQTLQKPNATHRTRRMDVGQRRDSPRRNATATHDGRPTRNAAPAQRQRDVAAPSSPGRRDRLHRGNSAVPPQCGEASAAHATAVPGGRSAQ